MWPPIEVTSERTHDVPKGRIPMNRLKLIPWLLGVALVAGSLIGANRLANPDTTSGGGAPNDPKKAKNTAIVDGLVVKGTVDSDPSSMSFFLPSHMPSGTIKEVLVRNGAEVKPGDVLVKFDDQFLQIDLKEATSAFNVAVTKFNQAKALKDQHGRTVEQAKLAVTNAEYLQARAEEGVALATRNFDKLNKLSGDLTTAELEKRRLDDPMIFEAKTKVEIAKNNVSAKALDQKLVEGQPVAETANEAQFTCELMQTKIEKIKLAIERCVWKADIGGVIEQVTATPGLVVGQQSRAPLFYLIPGGPRIVRAEVVPDFSYKIKDKIGQKVTITDDTNTALTYEGTVKRIGSAFLNKRNGGAADLLAGKASVALEIEIEVTDAAPAGKSPLRVGQPVRVAFP